MRFYLGTHHPAWLWNGTLTDVPLFVSRRALGLKRPKPATTPWALDSGGFSELSLYGEWRTTVPEYVDYVRRCSEMVGKLEWAAPMDWMVEPFMLTRTGLTLREHQRRTVENFIELREQVDEVIPVLQGWTQDDYEACLGLYDRAGVDLRAEPLVGVGSVCRRQGTEEADAIFSMLSGEGLRLHGFGVKLTGLGRFGHKLESSDSLAWSYRARRSAPLPGCVGHKNCANCQRFALRWRQQVLEAAA